MSLTVDHCLQVMEELAPSELAAEWDNIGLQIGSKGDPVEKILVALTITEKLVDRAVAEGVDLLICHHPLIFKPLKHIRTETPSGRLISKLIRNQIGVVVAHTNLDHAANGLNHWLAQELSLEDAKVLSPLADHQDVGLGRIGRYTPAGTLKEMATRIEKLWNVRTRIIGDMNRKCHRIAVCGGSGGSLVFPAKAAGADLLITGDVGYHDALEARECGLAVIDGGHFGTEKIMVEKVAEYLRHKLANCHILQGTEGDNPFQYLLSGGDFGGQKM